MELQHLDNGCLLHKVTELPITVICLVVFFFYYVIFWKHKLSSIKREQYCIGTWNVKSMNQGKLEVVKQEMTRVNVNILGISKLKWTGMGEFNSDDHYIYYYGQESLRRNGVAILVTRVQNAVLGCTLKTDRMIFVHFQSKPFNIIVIQAYAPTSNAEEAEVERFYEDLQDLLELTPKKRCPFHHRGLEC